ncbi:MAG: hypothetical protein LKM39_02675 [Chiayiivirga sp.]|jgi:hypothetical protein|nr:hypothetical protein [Chiayiivirga sp.]
MLLGALNYNNNPALMLCFLLGSAAHTSLLRAYLNLRGLRLEQVGADAVHAGEAQTLRLLFDAGEIRQRRDLVLRQGAASTVFALAPNRVETRLVRATSRPRVASGGTDRGVDHASARPVRCLELAESAGEHAGLPGTGDPAATLPRSR